MLDDKFNEINDKSHIKKYKHEIPLKDKFFMGDLERYYKYGIFPYILILHVFLLIFTSQFVKKLLFNLIRY